MSDTSKDNDRDGDEDAPRAKRSPIWPWLLAGVIIIGFIVTVLAVIFIPNPNAWTDDAYVTAHYGTIAPRVSGQVATVDVRDNQTVRQGQMLATLDPRDFQTSVDQAAAQLARDQAQVMNQSALIDRQPSEINQNSAQGDEIRARITLAQQNAERYRNLASTGAGPRQAWQQAESMLKEEEAQLAAAEAALEASKHQLDVLKAQHAAAEATVQADQAALDQAKLNLSYTHILAPMSGMIGEKSVQVGDLVSPGAALMVVVPLDRIFIEANYRELVLRHVLPGQAVRIHVDAYGIDLNGVVDSVPPASGAVFEPVAPTNATGNFTKIVQRLPIKILVLPNQPLARLLRLGLSVETTVHTGLANVVGRDSSAASGTAAP
ncbi:HlyD family secretion protein [Acidisoma cellulosilytica]|uniref:HlyD family secretion protein n=1 Tax=Acidisoma cellulosilyticum TaxID=2802395 RepID=A0A963Z7N2_9PROT|nr:HlyD family secretion protein [Acidisoma cellulosilyticum]MCB8884083.1 HlyD family secretion protein [Acidisoma cellulosilyticum]